MRRTRQFSPTAVTALPCAKGRTLTKERRRRADRCGAAASVQGSGVGWRALLLVELQTRSHRLCYRMQRVRPARQTWAPALVARTSRLLCFRSCRRSVELQLLVPRRTSRRVRMLRIERAQHRMPALPWRRTYHPHRRLRRRRRQHRRQERMRPLQAQGRWWAGRRQSQLVRPRHRIRRTLSWRPARHRIERQRPHLQATGIG